MNRPLAIDLYCGLGGWSEGLLAEGFDCVGFDIERHDYGGDKRYPAQLVLQDVLTLHGKQFRDAALIVASPPCQIYSYMAMPWSRAKAIAAEYRSGARDVKQLTALFDACFRIQREASEAAGRHIPLVVENVRGAIPWLGRSRWNYGSFHLWGDVPALMPMTWKGRKAPGFNLNHGEDTKWRPHRGDEDTKNDGGSWFNIGSPGQKELNRNPVHEGVKNRDVNGYERDHPDAFGWKVPRTSSRDSKARKAASAAIARIPLPLARHIARVYRPEAVA